MQAAVAWILGNDSRAFHLAEKASDQFDSLWRIRALVFGIAFLADTVAAAAVVQLYSAPVVVLSGAAGAGGQFEKVLVGLVFREDVPYRLVELRSEGLEEICAIQVAASPRLDFLGVSVCTNVVDSCCANFFISRQDLLFRGYCRVFTGAFRWVQNEESTGMTFLWVGIWVKLDNFINVVYIVNQGLLLGSSSDIEAILWNNSVCY